MNTLYTLKMYPDSKHHKPNSVRLLLGKLKLLGMTREKVAETVGKSSRAMRDYTSARATPDYPMQYTLEALLRREQLRRLRQIPGTN